MSALHTPSNATKPTTHLSPHQELAAAVIHRALLDLRDPHLPEAVRDGARRFLVGSEMFTHWCRVAGLDPALIRHRAIRASAQSSHLALYQRIRAQGSSPARAAARTTEGESSRRVAPVRRHSVSSRPARGAGSTNRRQASRRSH